MPLILVAIFSHSTFVHFVTKNDGDGRQPQNFLRDTFALLCNEKMSVYGHDNASDADKNGEKHKHSDSLTLWLQPQQH